MHGTKNLLSMNNTLSSKKQLGLMHIGPKEQERLIHVGVKLEHNYVPVRRYRFEIK